MRSTHTISQLPIAGICDVRSGEPSPAFNKMSFRCTLIERCALGVVDFSFSTLKLQLFSAHGISSDKCDNTNHTFLKSRAYIAKYLLSLFFCIADVKFRFADSCASFSIFLSFFFFFFSPFVHSIGCRL